MVVHQTQGPAHGSEVPSITRGPAEGRRSTWAVLPALDCRAGSSLAPAALPYGRAGLIRLQSITDRLPPHYVQPLGWPWEHVPRRAWG